MAQKKRKNSNYVTEKTILAKQQREAEQRRRIRNGRIKIGVYCGIALLLIAGIVIGILAACGVFGIKVTHHASIKIKNYGTVHVELYGEEAPETVANFVKLAEEGFYDGLTFHRIMEDFMAQGGCPNGDGTGNNGSTRITGEFSANGFKNRVKHERGTLSMARRGDDYNSASCQFFIVHQTSENNTKSLDGQYAAFGKVTDGMEFIDEMIAKALVVGNNGEVLAGYQPIIESITIHEAHSH